MVEDCRRNDFCCGFSDKVHSKAEGVDTSYLTHEDVALIADLNRVTVTRAIKTIHQLQHPA